MHSAKDRLRELIDKLPQETPMLEAMRQQLDYLTEEKASELTEKVASLIDQPFKVVELLVPKGKRFEILMFEELEHLGFTVRMQDEWDKEKKIDGALTCFDGRRLALPVEVQVTLRIDNARKIEKYLKMRDPSRVGTRLYVEPEDGMSPKLAARLVKKAYFDDILPRGIGKLTGDFGLHLRPDQTYELFDLEERLQELRRRDDPRQSRHMRLDGVVCNLKEHGFEIAASDQNVYWAYYQEISDRGLYARMCADPDFWKKPIEFPINVSFIPKTSARGSLRAASVASRDL